MTSPKKIKRCPWPGEEDSLMITYHDKEWGKPVRDDRKIFEFLVLESFQAGLSWRIVLHKRENFRKAFSQFDYRKVARFTAKDKARLVKDAGIVRNRLKIDSTVTNARAFLEVQREFGSFDQYLWSFVNRRPVINAPTAGSGVPTRTELSDRISKDLKKRGFRFVGTTILYAYLQAVGVVNDHSRDCFLYRPAEPARSGS